MEFYLPLQFSSATDTGMIQGRLYRPAPNVEASGLIVQIITAWQSISSAMNPFVFF